MHESFSILLNHGYLVVFVWVFADQAGLPLPSFPVLLAAGSLKPEMIHLTGNAILNPDAGKL